MKSAGLETRDLINVGVFTAVYFVIVFATGFIGVIGPWAMFAGFFAGVLLGGPVLVLLVVRSPKVGVLTIVGLLVALLMVLTGHYWGLLILAPLLGLAADLILRAGKYRKLAVAAAYAVFSLWSIGALLPVFFNADAYFAEIAGSMGAEYATAMRALFTPLVIVGYGIVLLIVGFVAGLFGTSLLRKHFRRAGLADAE